MLCSRVVTLPRPAPPSASLRVDLSAHPPTTTTAHHSAATLSHHRSRARTHSSITVLSLLRLLQPARALLSPPVHVLYQVTGAPSRSQQHLSQPFGARPAQRRRLKLFSTYHYHLEYRSSTHTINRNHLRPRTSPTPHLTHFTWPRNDADSRPPDFRPSPLRPHSVTAVTTTF